MPIYEYVCEKCGKLNEVMQKVDDPPPSKCDNCGGRKLRRVMSRSSFQLKGGGWYSDLYGNAKPKSEAKGSSSGASEGKSSDAKSPDTKPASTKPAAEASPSKTKTKN